MVTFCLGRDMTKFAWIIESYSMRKEKWGVDSHIALSDCYSWEAPGMRVVPYPWVIRRP